jgi:quinoprotein glucose dehydrogenase
MVYAQYYYRDPNDPAGFGTGLSDAYQDHFFICDFRGSPAQSGVHSFAVKPKGASFELIDQRKFFWSILCTDVAFGPGGGLYVSDWVETWEGAGKGRIYRAFDPSKQDDPLIAETGRLLAQKWDKEAFDNLPSLLGHADMRVRLEAQFEMARRGERSERELAKLARDAHAPIVKRLHAIWGLGQIGRNKPRSQQQRSEKPEPATSGRQRAERAHWRRANRPGDAPRVRPHFDSPSPAA